MVCLAQTHWPTTLFISIHCKQENFLFFDDNSMEEMPPSESHVNQSVFNSKKLIISSILIFVLILLQFLVTALVFNCSYFGHDCSSCIAAQSSTIHSCVWCSEGDPNSGECVQSSKCQKTLEIQADHQCPNPEIM